MDIKLTVDAKPLVDGLARIEATLAQVAAAKAPPATVPGVVVGVAAAACASTRRVSRRALLGLSWLSPAGRRGTLRDPHASG